MIQAALALHLVCGGSGTHVSQDTATATRNYDYTDSVQVTSRSRSGYAAEVIVEIEGDEGRILVPDGIKPPIRAGGDDGWWRLRNIEVSDDEIRASVSLNFMNHPRIRIDRRSGNISIRGMNGNYNGYCEARDPEARRF